MKWHEIRLGDFYITEKGRGQLVRLGTHPGGPHKFLTKSSIRDEVGVWVRLEDIRKPLIRKTDYEPWPPKGPNQHLSERRVMLSERIGCPQTCGGDGLTWTGPKKHCVCLAELLINDTLGGI